LRRPLLPFPVNAVIIAVGALLVGKNVATSYVAPQPQTVVQRGVSTKTETLTVKRKIRGHVIRLKSGLRVIHVPLIVVHTDERVIRIPAHNLPITRRLGAAVSEADPVVTVTVYVPSEPVTVTATATTTETVSEPPITLTTTVSVPLSPDPTTSDQGGLS
jgi:hypothetical protein